MVAAGRAGAYLRSLDPKLPHTVWILETGFFLNAFGTGIAYPFLVIYLHNVRGIGLGTAGLVVAATGFVGLLFGPLMGRAVDRFGPRPTLAAALLVGATGYALFALVEDAWSAFLVAGLVGIGSAGFWPAQSTLLAGLAPPTRRHAAYAVQRGMFNLGLGLGGMTGGLIASTASPDTFTVLFLLDAAATLGFAAVLPFVPDPGFHRVRDVENRPRAGYRNVLRDRPFMSLIALNVVFVSAGYTQLELLPVFAKNEAGVSEQAIGLIFLASSVALVVCQLPVAKIVEGRSRMRALAGDAGALGIGLADRRGRRALVRGHSRGRGLRHGRSGLRHRRMPRRPGPYRTRGRSGARAPPGSLLGGLRELLGLGYIVGPAVGGLILAAEPLALWPLAAGVCGSQWWRRGARAADSA